MNNVKTPLADGTQLKPLLLSLDPSINHLGWAVFDINERKLLASGVVQAPQKMTKLPFGQRIVYIKDQLLSTLRALELNGYEVQTVIEEPQLWGAYKSVASQHSGSLLGLYLLCGALFMYFSLNAPADKTQLIPVSQWKGQLPKSVTQARMLRRWGRPFKSTDEADAVGLGTYVLDTLLKDTK